MANACSVLPLPLTIEEISRDWLTAALRVKAPGVTVQDFEVAEIIHATSTSAKLRLQMDKAGKEAGIPETVFVKGGFQEHSRDLAFMHRCETLGYRDLMPTSGLNAPTCYFAEWDEQGQQGIVIMEDLTQRGGTFGHLRVTRSKDEVAQGLTLLANYHSQSWGCPAFGPDHEYSWVLQGGPFDTSPYKDFLNPEPWKGFMTLPRAAATSNYFQDLDWVIDTRRRLDILSKRVPNCILHGDAHPGNVFFQDNGQVAFFDIVTRRAPAMYEAAYHITLSLDPVDRPRWERDLVRHYLGELKGHGVNPPDLDEAMFQYGVFLADMLIMGLCNIPGVVPEDTCTAASLRQSAAAIDNDTIGLLKTITD